MKAASSGLNLTWVPMLEQSIAGLTELNQVTEQDFLNVGERLFAFVGGVQKISSELHELNESFTAEPLTNAGNALTAVLLHGRQLAARNEQDRALLVKMRTELSQAREARAAGGPNGVIALMTVIETTIKEASVLQSGLAIDLPLSISASLAKLGSLGDVQLCAQGSSKRLVACYSVVSEAFNNLIVAVQFHDITRQQVEHVIMALAGVNARVPGRGDGLPLRASDIAAVLTLQVGQIANASEKFAASFASIVANMEHIANHVLEIAGAGSSSRSFFPEPANSLLLELERSCQTTLATFHRCLQARAALQAAQRRVVEAIEQRPGSSALLRQLAETLQNGLEKDSTAGWAGPEEGPWAEIRSAIGALRSSSERSCTQATRVSDQGTHLYQDVIHTRDGLTVGKLFAETASRVQAQLAEISAAILVGAPWEGADGLPPELAALTQNYTMRSEREVHEGLCGAATAIGAADQNESSEEFGDNVLLF